MFRVLALVLICAGCADRDEARLMAIRSEVCGCQTSACAELAMKQVPHDDIHPTRRTRAIAREMINCLAKLYEAERPVADPDEASDPGSAAPASAEKP